MERLLELPLEQLMDIPVTTVAGVEQDWFRSPAALHVVTGEDLRRTGHRTLAEALRVVPGVFVGQSGSRTWTVGMRGFSGGLANKTLVLIDGRAVYDPLFGGTFWDVQDILLEDLERIEVIRGPGATLWGANAVNGVINVITRRAHDTQGFYLKAGGGNEEHVFTSARYGGKASDNGYYRVWGKYVVRDHTETMPGGDTHDEWDLGHGGFRFDYDVDEQTRVTVQSDGYDVDFDENQRLPVPGMHLSFMRRRGHGWASGANFLARVTRDTGESGWSLQTYYDFTDRQQAANFEVERHTADIDVRHHFVVGGWNDVMWGLGYRYTADSTRSSPVVEFDPSSRSLETFSGFLQDTITVIPERLFAMIGSKLEHNSFTGVEVQPSGRLWWTPDDRNTLWASISRPVRVPSRTERDSTLTLGFADPGLLIDPAGPPAGFIVPLQVVGDPDLKSEKVLAYELGHRIRITPELSLDTALFYNDYDDLIFVPKGTFGAWNNDGTAETFGFELSAEWRILEPWRLAASYSFVEVEVHGPVLPQDQGNAPHHLVKARSHFDVTDDVELDTALYFVDQVPTVDADEYVRLDQGITWRATDNIELALWGQNLLQETHREASPTVQIERAIYLSATVQF
ncbi:MAG TPA: TonB-dependent receptor [Candidatus Limnocylindrales bacterium]|nr:TonB-dependent receptor [Candidatus Limnocylindrales bacterium]